MRGSLFVPDENELEWRMIEAGKEVKYGPAGQTENRLNSGIRESVNRTLGTCSHARLLVFSAFAPL